MYLMHPEDEHTNIDVTVAAESLERGQIKNWYECTMLQADGDPFFVSIPGWGPVIASASTKWYFVSTPNDALYVYSFNTFPFGWNLLNHRVIDTDSAYYRPIRDTQGIFCYDSDGDEWTLIFNYPSTLRLDEHITYWNSTKNELFLCGKHYDEYSTEHEICCALIVILVQLDTKQSQIVMMDPDIVDIEIGMPSIAYIDGEYHIIGGSTHSHSKFKSNHITSTPSVHSLSAYNLSDLVAVTDVNELYGISLHGFVELKSHRKCLLFGGYDYRSGETRDSFWEYDTVRNQWTKLKLKLPRKLRQFGYVLTPDERYIIVIGGMDEEDAYSDKIYIVDLKKMRIRESVMQCPRYSILNACLYLDPRDAICSEGFVRKCTKEMDMYVPIELSAMVNRWYATQDIHLLVYHSDRDEDVHFRIDLQSVMGDSCGVISNQH